MATVNSPEVYEAYLHSGFFTLIRETQSAIRAKKCFKSLRNILN